MDLFAMMDLRELKGLEIAARAKLVWKYGECMVPSQSGGSPYKVERRLFEFTCTCEDYQLNRRDCKHIIAARLVLERDGEIKAPPVDTSAVPKKPTYRQNWPAYNLAQTTEKHRLQVLLNELCGGVPTPVQVGKGQRAASMPDVLFSMAFKVYTCLPARRFMCDLSDAHERGHVSQVIHYNSVCRHFENPELTPILHSLITRSALPLRAVELDFAPDSTGFSTSRFVKWYDHKYGVTRTGHDWVKVHVMTGVKTNVITAVEIRDRDANDSPILPDLLGATVKNFTVREVPADKGYSSVDNIETILRAGATPYIPFKENTTGAAGGLWEKMFHYYSFNRDEFLKHYHKRSNVESTFSMVKAKFRDHVRSKSDAAMKNEVLCKLLCHNLCVVIQSQCELGIEAAFWQNEPEKKPDVLPLVRPG